MTQHAMGFTPAAATGGAGCPALASGPVAGLFATDDALWQDFFGTASGLAPPAAPQQSQAVQQPPPSRSSTPLPVAANTQGKRAATNRTPLPDDMDGGSTSPSSGEEQAPPMSQLDAVWAAAAARPATKSARQQLGRSATDTDASSALAWASSTSLGRHLDCAQLPNAGALQVRRAKNRECMRRARQRQREELREMKSTVAKLEKQYSELCLRSAGADAGVRDANRGCSPDDSERQEQYSLAVGLAKRLGAENLYLKASIQQQATWKLHLYRILESRPEMDGPAWAQQFQQPALGGDEALKMQLDKLDEAQAARIFGFHALTELDLTHVILDNNRCMTRVQNRLLLPSTLDTQGRTRTRRMQTFGWDIVQRVEDSVMECVFTKRFTGLDVAEVMRRTWANDMRLDQFKKVKCETQRLEVLQQVNPNAYVLGRDVASPTAISTFRSVFVRFLIETSRQLPASDCSVSTPTFASATSSPPSDSDEPMLTATGYVLGTQSVHTDYCSGQLGDGGQASSRLAWADLSLAIEFLNVVNPATGEEYQQLRWTGRTDYCGEEHAHRNAADTLQGMLRWEMFTIAPALNLVSLCST